MNQLNSYWYFLFITLLGCTPNHDKISLVNPAHLDSLFELIDIDNSKMGTIWIYCEAPDYVLTADDDEGFTCVDDVARALVFYCKQYRLQRDDVTLDRIKQLSTFLLYMQHESGLFYNFMFLDKTINKIHPNSQAIPNWWSWRAFWALSEVSLLDEDLPSSLRHECRNAITSLLPYVNQFCLNPDQIENLNGIDIPICFTQTGADQASIILLALTNYYQIEKDDLILDLISHLGKLLMHVQVGEPDLFPFGAFFSWKTYWHGWGNSQAYALLRAGRITADSSFITAGLNEVKNFYPYCLEQGFINEFQVVKKEGKLILENFKQFPQIAYSLRPMIYASLEAYSQTQDSSFAILAGHLATWFRGNNPSQKPMYDPFTGRTFDGIGSQVNINVNSGAESTIEGLLCIQAIEANSIAKRILMEYKE